MGFLPPAKGVLAHTAQTVLFTEYPPTSQATASLSLTAFLGPWAATPALCPASQGALAGDGGISTPGPSL